MAGSFSLNKTAAAAVASNRCRSRISCLKRQASVSVSLPRGSGMMFWDGKSTVLDSPSIHMHLYCMLTFVHIGTNHPGHNFLGLMGQPLCSVSCQARLEFG